MQVFPSQHAEYERRHNPIWPELEATLNDPQFYTTRAKDAPALHAELESTRAQAVRVRPGGAARGHGGLPSQ